ncbi:MAG: HTH-type transcriptional regulator CysB [Pseudohongiellaceae bacterium]
MKLQQLRYVREVVKQRLNVSQAAQSLYTSQPGISRQIKKLEEELETQLFTRSGKHLTRLTSAGTALLPLIDEVLEGVTAIQRVAADHADPNQGTLAIATTHTQSRYVLPAVIKRFIQRYPRVSLHMHQGSPMQISQLAADGTADFAIATEALEHFSDLLMMPCYQWNRVILVPRDHELARSERITIAQLASYPLVTYTFGFTGRSRLDEAFHRHQLTPQVVFTAADADVIKTYVRLGLGVGIVARMAHEPDKDADLVAIDASHLFAPSVTSLGFRKGMQLRGYMIDFIQMFAAHLQPELIRRVQQAGAVGVESLFKDVALPAL